MFKDTYGMNKAVRKKFYVAPTELCLSLLILQADLSY